MIFIATFHLSMLVRNECIIMRGQFVTMRSLSMSTTSRFVTMFYLAMLVRNEHIIMWDQFVTTRSLLIFTARNLAML
eukprot:131921-Alexandrium_andersonii.AAC.1